jgi:hypothetical protein
MAKPDFTKAHYERRAELRYLPRCFLIFSQKAAVQAGLTAEQHQATSR